MEVFKMICEIQWWPVLNDLIGGWTIIASDLTPPISLSLITLGEQYLSVADLIQELDVVEYICNLHNQSLGGA